MTNDGVPGPAASRRDGGGLDNLALRLEAVGGSLTTQAGAGGRFDVLATVPLAAETALSGTALSGTALSGTALSGTALAGAQPPEGAPPDTMPPGSGPAGEHPGVREGRFGRRLGPRGHAANGYTGVGIGSWSGLAHTENSPG